MKSPSLEALDSEHVQLTLDTKHAFAVWRALQCYSDMFGYLDRRMGSKASSGIGGLEIVSSVLSLLDQHMRKQLGLGASDDPVVYCTWDQGCCVYRDADTGYFVCSNCPIQVDESDHVVSSRHEMILHLERHIRNDKDAPMHVLERLRAEIKGGAQ